MREGEIPLSGRPNNLAVTPDGKRIVIAITDPGGLDIIDTAGGKRAKTISPPSRPRGRYFPAGHRSGRK